MKHIQEQDRNQTRPFPISLDLAIDQDGEARVTDLFVEKPNLSDLGFRTAINYTNADRPLLNTPIGTIKQSRNFREEYNYIINKKHIERAEADFGFIMTAYNLRSLLNRIGRRALVQNKHVLNGLFAFKNTHFYLKKELFRLCSYQNEILYLFLKIQLKKSDNQPSHSMIFGILDRLPLGFIIKNQKQ